MHCNILPKLNTINAKQIKNCCHIPCENLVQEFKIILSTTSLFNILIISSIHIPKVNQRIFSFWQQLSFTCSHLTLNLIQNVTFDEIYQIGKYDIRKGEKKTIIWFDHKIPSLPNDVIIRQCHYWI